MIKIETGHGLPKEYECFLVERYGSYLATSRYAEIYYPNEMFFYMQVFEDGSLTDLLMFAKRRNFLQCLNALADIAPQVVEDCVNRIFEILPEVNVVKIDASFNEYLLPRSFLCSRLNNHVITLPESMEAFMEGLGKRTRKMLRMQKQKFQKSYPDARFVVRYGEDITLEVIEAIVRLSSQRLKRKGIARTNNTDVRAMYNYCQSYGCVTSVEVDGEIVAGTIGYILKNNLYGCIIGHRESFSVYSLGKLSQLYEIEVAVDNKLSRLHLLWGDNDYKQHISASSIALSSYLVFRKYSMLYFFTRIKFFFQLKIRQLRLLKALEPLKILIRNSRKKVWKLFS